MNSSHPNDEKDNKAPQPTNGAPSQAQPVNDGSSSSSDSDSGKGAAGQNNQYVVGVPPQQAMGPTWSTGLFECFDDIPTRKSSHISFVKKPFYLLYLYEIT